MSKYYQISEFYPHLKNPQRYKGTRPLTLRSGWEIHLVAKFLDTNSSVIEWTSESVIVKYISPVDNQQHRYYIDFSAKLKAADGSIKEVLIEVKPHKETLLPKEPKRKTQRYVNEVKTYLVNQAKWATAKALCEEYKKKGRSIEFLVLTEKDCPWFIS